MKNFTSLHNELRELLKGFTKGQQQAINTCNHFDYHKEMRLIIESEDFEKRGTSGEYQNLKRAYSIAKEFVNYDRFMNGFIEYNLANELNIAFHSALCYPFLKRLEGKKLFKVDGGKTVTFEKEYKNYIQLTKETLRQNIECDGKYQNINERTIKVHRLDIVRNTTFNRFDLEVTLTIYHHVNKETVYIESSIPVGKTEDNQTLNEIVLEDHPSVTIEHYVYMMEQLKKVEALEKELRNLKNKIGYTEQDHLKKYLSNSTNEGELKTHGRYEQTRKQAFNQVLKNLS